MSEEKLTISEAAALLSVSIDTLRRWDKSGKLPAKKSPGGHRYYSKLGLELFKENIFALAADWVLGAAKEPESKYYCPTSGDFKGRLSNLQRELESSGNFKGCYPLVVAVGGEIGNNSYDHNLGSWPDVSGIFFAFNTSKRQIVLADRGHGILKTIKNIKPEVRSYGEALEVAFTQVISGRAPEARGNGLKFVREVAIKHLAGLEFYSGDAKAVITKKMLISGTDIFYSGCLVLIKY